MGEFLRKCTLSSTQKEQQSSTALWRPPFSAAYYAKQLRAKGLAIRPPRLSMAMHWTHDRPSRPHRFFKRLLRYIIMAFMAKEIPSPWGDDN
jgi:hypothetical protein